MIKNSKKNGEADNYDWCFTSGKVSVLESYMLNYKQFEEMLSVDTVENLLKYFTNAKLRYSFSSNGSVAEIERAIESYCFSKTNEIRAFSPSKIVCDIFLIRYKLQDIKNSLKKKFSGTPDEQISVDILKNLEIEHSWKRVETPSGWPLAMLNGMERLKRTLHKDEEPKNNSRWIIDLIMDNTYLSFLKTISEETSSPYIKQYLEKFIFLEMVGSLLRTLALGNNITPLSNFFFNDLHDINNFPNILNLSINDCKVLLKNELSSETVNTIFPNNNERAISNPNIVMLEKISADYLLNIARPWKHIAFGPERILGYLCGLFTEAYNLKLVISGKINGIDSLLLKDRLRICYV